MYFHRELITFGMTEWVKGSLVWTQESCGWVTMAGVELVRRRGGSGRSGSEWLRAAPMVLLPSTGDRGLEAPA